MQPWLIARAISPTDPRGLAQRPIGLLNRITGDAFAMTSDEKWRSATLIVAILTALRRVLRQFLIQFRSERHESRFVEFGLTDSDQSSPQVDIRQCQCERFTHAQAGSIEQE
jgi:hypothetical protein